MENWDKIEDIFNSALNISPNARVDFVNEQCEGDKHLRHQVLTLLNADDNSDNYLSSLSETLYPLINDMESDKVKHYHLLEKIGEGGMGVVYKAFDEKLHRTVAIKFLLSYRAKNSSDKKRFIHEAKAAAGLSHPNVCEVYEVDETEDGRLYIVTAFCEGRNLSELISEKKLTISAAFKIAIQLCEALKTAHNNDIIHRDLKPENVIVNDDFNIQLVDFGIAKTAGSDMSQTGQIVGTFAYMSPEQFSAGMIDQRTDIWALGILLFESLTGERPFNGENAAEIMYQIFNSEIPKVSTHESPLITRINHIIERCLSIDKQRRYHSTDSVKNELHNLLDNLKASSEETLLCNDYFQMNNLQKKYSTANNNTVNEYRKILTLGITCYCKTKEGIEEKKQIKNIIKKWTGNISNEKKEKSYDGKSELIIAHFGFPLHSEKSSANILNCLQSLLTLPTVNEIIIHNLPVTVSDNNKTGQRQILGDISGTIESLIDIKKTLDTSIVITESASIRLRKTLPTSLKMYSKKTNNENLFLLKKIDAEKLLTPSRDQHATQLTGRYHELGLLESAWKDINDGDSRAVLITGEAGMGKTRLLHELIKSVGLKSNVANEKHLIIDCTFDPLQQDTAFFPIIKAISANIFTYAKNSLKLLSANEEKNNSTPQNVLINKLSVEKWLASVFSNNKDNYSSQNINKDEIDTLLWLLGKANCMETDIALTSVQHESAESLKKKIFKLFNKILSNLTRKQTILLIFEDLHWADFSSLEWIDKLLSKPLPQYLLVAMTGRPELFHRWRAYSGITQLSLNKLGRSESRDFIHSLHTKTLLPEDVENRIIEKTAGNPLFIEEYVNMVARQTDDLNTDAVPDSLDDILLSRLDLLGHSKVIAQAASAIGRIFDEGLLQKILETGKVDYSNNLSSHLSVLNEADIIFEALADQFTFKHALIRDALYQTISTNQRQEFHLLIANTLLNAYQEGDNASEERIAQHFSSGLDYQKSIEWWLKAARHAWSSHALMEVKRLCENGIKDLDAFRHSLETKHSDLDLINQEIELQMILGRAGMAAEGYASNTAAKAHQRALHLATSPKTKLKTFPALIGMWAHYCVSAQHIAAGNVAQTLVDIADQYYSDDLLVEAYMLRGTTYLFRGEFSKSHSDLSVAANKLTPEMQQPHINAYGQDPGVVIYSFFAILKEICGDSDNALLMSQKAIDSARQSQHPFSLSFALSFAVHIQIRLRNNQEAQLLIDENKRICAEHGIHVFRLLGAIQEGLLTIGQGKAHKGVTLIEKNIPQYQAMGANLFMGTWHGVLSLTLLKIGEKELAIEHLEKGVAAVNKSGEIISQGVLSIAAQHLNITPNFSEPFQSNKKK
ncbi:MAG: protein kinase [Cellvibrionaceae bacterium]